MTGLAASSVLEWLSSMISDDPLLLVLLVSIGDGVLVFKVLTGTEEELALISFGCRNWQASAMDEGCCDRDDAKEVGIDAALNSSALEEKADCIEAAC